MRLVTCIYEPRGEDGLEGFALGETYQLVERGDCRILLAKDGTELGRTYKQRKVWKYFTEVRHG